MDSLKLDRLAMHPGTNCNTGILLCLWKLYISKSYTWDAIRTLKYTWSLPSSVFTCQAVGLVFAAREIFGSFHSKAALLSGNDKPGEKQEGWETDYCIYAEVGCQKLKWRMEVALLSVLINSQPLKNHHFTFTSPLPLKMEEENHA